MSATAPIATRTQFAEQLPYLVSYRRVEAASGASGIVESNGSASASAKRKAPAAKRKLHVHEHAPPEDGIVTAEVHRSAPCFALLPASIYTTKKDAAAAAAAAAASTPTATPAAMPALTPVTSPFVVAPIPPLAKKARKALAADYAAFMAAFGTQAQRALVEALPRNVLRVAEREREYARELARVEAAEAALVAGEEYEAAAASSRATFHFAPAVVNALDAAKQRIGVQASPANVSERLQSTKEEPDVPLTRLFQHQPRRHTSYPALGASQTQHGWSFFQPTRAQPIHSFNRIWIDRLKAELGEFHSILQLLRSAFTLSLPRAGDASNVDLEISEEMLTDIKHHLEWVAALRLRLTNYNENRAKLLTKVYKYPGVDDYHAAVREIDSYMRMTLGINWLTLRNGLWWIHQLFARNEHKLALGQENEDTFNSML